MIEVMIVLYVLFTMFCVVMSYNEQGRDPNRGLMVTLLTLMACIAWPVTIAAMLIFAPRAQAQTVAQPKGSLS